MTHRVQVNNKTLSKIYTTRNLPMHDYILFSLAD